MSKNETDPAVSPPIKLISGVMGGASPKSQGSMEKQKKKKNDLGVPLVRCPTFGYLPKKTSPKKIPF